MFIFRTIYGLYCMITLRPYQDICTGGVRLSYKNGNRRVLLVSAAGSGKTIMFSYMAAGAAARGKKVLIMAHMRELCLQCGDKLEQNDVSFGYVTDGFTPDYSKSVQVGTVQTIITRMHEMYVWDSELREDVLWKPDMIIIDEAHRSTADTYTDILNFYPDALLLGVTATPIRSDGTSLGDLYQDMVLGPQTKDLTPKYLLPLLVFAPEVEVDLSEVRVNEWGEYNKGDIIEAVDKPFITGDAVKAYIDNCPGAKAVAFCTSIKHSRTVCEAFKSAGYIFEHVDGKTKSSERARIFKQLASGEIHGITSVNLVTEGFDSPILQCAISLRPTQNVGLYIQMISRVLRPYEGQEFAYHLDHAGLTRRHGLITEERNWSLVNESKKERREREERSAASREFRQCPECFTLHAYGPKCENPECGHVYEINSREIEVVDGELKLFEPVVADDIDTCDEMFDQLKQIGKQKGYADSWAINIWADWQKKLNN